MKTQGRRGSLTSPRFLFTIVAVVIVGTWIIPAVRKSLWIDEAGTYWVVKDGLSQTWHRALTFQGQSPLFYVVEWVMKKLFGRSELGLRLPSLLSAGVSTFLVYRLGTRLRDKQLGMYSAVVFAGLSGVVLAASDARPYALALMLLIAATHALVRWVETGGFKGGAVYAVMLALTLYAHYLFVLPVAAHIAYVAVGKHAKVSRKAFFLSLCATTVLSSAAIPQLFSLLSRRASLEIPTSLSAQAFIEVLLPPAVVAGLVAGWLFTRTMPERMEGVSSSTLALIAMWFIVPPLCLYLVSLVSGTTLFDPRYYLSAVPALALMTGTAISMFPGERTKGVLLLAVVVCSMLIVPAGINARDEGWREAITVANSISDKTTPVLLRTTLVEEKQESWLSDPEKSSYLLSPISFYPLRGIAILLPLDIRPDSRPRMEQIAVDVLARSPRFILVTRESDPFGLWLQGRMGPLGFVPTDSGTFGSVYLVVFSR